MNLCMKEENEIYNTSNTTDVPCINKYVFYTQLDCMRKMEIHVSKVSIKNLPSNVLYLKNIRFLCFNRQCEAALESMKRLMVNKNILEIINMLSGITCRGSITSCSDQLAWALTRIYLREVSEGYKQKSNKIRIDGGES